MIEEARAKAMLRYNRGISINGDLLYAIKDFVSNGRLCINPGRVLNLAEDLVSTILKPVEDLVSAAMQPIVNEVKKNIPGQCCLSLEASTVFREWPFENSLDVPSRTLLEMLLGKQYLTQANLVYTIAARAGKF